MNAEALEKVCTSTRDVIANVRPDQYDLPTPCSAWDVRQLLNHLVPVPASIAETMRKGGFEFTQGAERPDVVGPGMADDYEKGFRAVIAAFSEPGAFDKKLTMPGAAGDMDATVFLNMSLAEVLLHGWDVAKATGQSTDLVPDVASELLKEAAVIMPDAYRGQEGQGAYGPAIDAPESASAADRLAAYAGRQV